MNIEIQEDKLMTKDKKTIYSNRLKTAQKFHAWGITLFPFLGFIVALALVWYKLIGVIEICLMLGMWFLSSIGITVGFHRYFAHRAFKTSSPMQVILAILGSMAGQGPLIYWVALHRRHHENSDQAGDPHSPRIWNQEKLEMWRGLWHAHIQWIFVHEIPNPIHYAPELLRDKVISRVNQLYYVWLFLSLIISAILGGILRGSWLGFIYGLLWGGIVRIFIGENLIWSINSITHYFGQRPFATRDYSTNNYWLAIPSLGESWHNNHHAFNNSAIFGLEWWQVDLGGVMIRTLEKLGLVWDVKVPSQQMIESQKIFNSSVKK